MISLKQLHYALAVEKTLHFKKAADACNVSQSALSTAIIELEKQLGTTIFERNNKQVLITSYGQLILNKARTVKLEVDELLQISQSNNQPLIQPMTLGVIPTIGPYLLPKVLPEVRRQYPNFKLKIIEEQSQVLVDMVRRGDIDAAVLALPFPIDGLMSFDFWQEDFYWVSHKDECPSQLKEITSAELEIDKLMLLKDGHCLKDHALAACSMKGDKQQSDFDSASLHTLIQMVAGKLGTTLVPQMALDQLIYNESEIRAIHLNEPGPHRTIALIIRPNYVRTNELTMLRDIFNQELTAKC
ncbi:LysR family transcriptional regulator [Colwellia sp. MB02u-18]|uniref:hydrogen peroxide-inducible genes activator n=1 Tax=unclassified Colwellia TaxID=196834 RepID=UPI0015F6EF6F|nr:MULTISPECIES: hydrogen peroxide-inducible genes activator [unclassified Colwellia]MBA6224062.1 LysR family transcriptional regulator [Colwellia sp. MB3u-45]MBA6269046.1 LysR family transcriptional regulator [Colwellia sp. MB3u-43]MBA6320868.1 LysR family transcriptional regulator [Colwellia sp. MB02u-19]MBA6324148.1 LysR family transcriptional regulator [Colwellia sp. MB02u-18]MBA6332697.1 LysR family transcriptional regulator [Colwellia sp. MB02u-12]